MSTTTATGIVRVICPHHFTDSDWNMEWLEKERSGDYIERIVAKKRAGFTTERGPATGSLMTQYDHCPKCNEEFAVKKTEALEFMRKALV